MTSRTLVDPAGGLPDPGWWIRGLAPHERAAEPAANATRPAWATFVEHAVRAVPPPPPDIPAGWREAFAIPLRPLVVNAGRRLADLARPHLVAGDADLRAVVEGFTARLGDQLVGITARTLVLELNEHRTAGRLSGEDGRERFAHFVRELAGPGGLAGLFAAYPVLARLLGNAALTAADADAELLTRFAADRGAVVTSLLSRVDPGPVIAIDARRGDPHRHGRSVSVVVLAGGGRVVYRPRDVAPYLRFAELARWLNRMVPDLGLRTVGVVARAGYGWLEFLEGQPLLDRSGADRFYRRQGALLALLHAVHAVDVHFQNVIACGDQPVLVDVETLFHPDLPAGRLHGGVDDPAARALADSVNRIGLLPRVVVGENGPADLSGLGADRRGVTPSNRVDWEFPGTDRMRLVRRAGELRGGLHRPRLGGDEGVEEGAEEIDPGDHQAALVDGFRRGYDAIMHNREEFTALIGRCADLEVRLVARPTDEYVTLLDETTHPDLLRDARNRDRVLDVLRSRSADDPLRRHLSRHELADLWAGDVPLFTGRPGSRDIWTASGQRLPRLLDRTGLGCAVDTVAAMNEVARRDQEWVIAATMATRRPPGGHRSVTPVPGQLSGAAAHPERLLTAACAVADQIVSRSLADQDRVNWLGLELVDDRQWLVLPMGAGLANGYVGVALFLAQLTEISGIVRYARLARQAITAVPRLLETLVAHPAMVTAIGCGGLHGLGGITYALARLGTLLADNEVRAWARTAVDLTGTLVGTAAAPVPLGWATGTAGCLAAMTTTHTELGLAPAARLARRCADRLATVMANDDPLPDGFADGAAGMAWALTRFATHFPDDTGPRHTRAAHAAASSAVAALPGDGTGWCSGTAGLLLAQTCAPGGDLESWVPAFVDRPLLRDLSLCHGESGVADTLIALPTPAAGPVRLRHAGLVLDAVDRYGPISGTPDGVPTPGLLNGLAGIGYGLLRLGFPDRVPSPLLLEPTPAPHVQDRRG